MDIFFHVYTNFLCILHDKYVHIPIIHSHSIQTVLYDLKTTKEEKDEKKKKHEEEGEEKLLSHRSSEQ